VDDPPTDMIPTANGGRVISARPRRRLRRLAILPLGLTLLVAQLLPPSISAAGPGPGSGVREGVVFYYQRITPATPLTKFGRAAMVITVGQDGESDDQATRDAKEQAAVERIHAAGARAYRYVNAYWLPRGAEYDGLDIWSNPGFIFCRSGWSPLLGKLVQDSGSDSTTEWYFLDLNERAARNYFSATWFPRIHQTWGYDGIFLDRGAAALQGGKDAEGADVWDRVSTCTHDPVVSGRTMADAFVSLASRAQAAGLDVILNYGTSPYGRGPKPRLRPDPRDHECRVHHWKRCRILDDVWSRVDYVLDEEPAPNVPEPGSLRYRSGDWALDKAQNLLNETDERAGKVIGLIKNANTSDAGTRASQVLYQWARARLYDLQMAVNTGDDGCPNSGTGDFCWRYADAGGDPWPDLASVELGAPFGSAPFAVSCDPGSSVRCIWVRRYAWGMVMVNRSGTTRSSGRVKLALASCRYIFRVREQAFADPNTCVSSIGRTFGPWSARVYEYDLDGQL
jgi:hypothetical protein